MRVASATAAMKATAKASRIATNDTGPMLVPASLTAR
jgi:hypothetical protein